MRCPDCSELMFAIGGVLYCDCGNSVKPERHKQVDLLNRVNELMRERSILVEALQRIVSNDPTATPSAIALTALERILALHPEKGIDDCGNKTETQS